MDTNNFASGNTRRIPAMAILPDTARRPGAGQPRFMGLLAAAIAGTALLFQAAHAPAASYYFDPNGTTAGSVADGGSYTWAGTNWATAAGGTAATVAYVGGNNAPVFAATNPGLPLAYTVTMNPSATSQHNGFSVLQGTVTFIGPTNNFYCNSNATFMTNPGAAAIFNQTGGNAFNLNAKVATFNGDFTVNTVMTNNGSITISGGTLLLTAANTFRGDVLVSGGTLRLTNNLAIQNGNYNVSGAGIFDVSALSTPTFGGLKGAGTLTLPTNITALTLNPINTVTNNLSGNLSSAGTLALNKNGAGVQIISGVSDFTGPTTINAGTLEFAAGGALTNSDLTVKSAAILQVDSPGTTLKSVAVEGGAILTLTAARAGVAGVNTTIAETLTFTAAPSFSVRPIFTVPPQAGDTFNLLTAGSVVNAPGTITADFSVNGASRIAGSIAMVGNSMILTILTAAGDLTWDNGGATGVWNLNTDANFSAGQKFMQYDSVTFGDTAAGAVTLTGALYPNTVTINSSANYTFSGTGGINGGATLLKSGASTLTLSNTASAYTRGTTVSAGVLQASTPAALPGAVEVSPSATLNLLGPGAVTFANNLSGAGRVLVTLSGGTNNVYLSGASTGFTGTLELWAAAAQGNKLNISNLTLDPAALIKANPFTQIYANGKNLPNPLQIIGTGNSETRGAIRLGAVTLSGPITLLGDATIGCEGGTISGDIAGGISGLQTLTMGTAASAATAFLTGQISDGAGVIALNIAKGTNTLGGANTFSGGTVIAGGLLSATTSTALGSGAVIINAVSGNRLQIAGGLNIANPLTIHGGGATGLGILHATTANAADATVYSGDITIDGNAASGGHLGTSNGGLMDLTGVITYVGGTVSQRVGLVKLSNAGSNYSGLMIGQDTVRLGVTNAIPVAAAVTIGGSGTSYLDLAGFDQTLASVTKGGSAGTMGNSSTTNDSMLTITGVSTYAGVIQDILGAGTRKTALTINGGTLTLSGANTYTGGTNLQAGQLNINSATAIGGTTSTLTIADGTTIDNTGAADIALTNNNAQNWNGDFTYAGSVRNLNLGAGAVTMSASRQVTVTANTLAVGGAISGAGFGLAKAGAGTLNLQGDNTYTGATTINAGTLEIAGTTPFSDFTVKNTGALQIDNLGDALQSLAIEDGATLVLPAVNTGATGVNTTITNALSFTALPPNFTVRPMFGVVPHAGDVFNLLTAGSVLNAAGTITADFTFGGASTVTGTIAVVDNKLVLTIITGATDLVWNNSVPTGIWNINTDANFTSLKFNQYDGVTFGDAGAGVVTLAGVLLPSGLTVNSSINYTFSGAGSISGLVTLNKAGVSTLTLSTANTYTGGTNITGGGIIAGADSNFGSVAVRNPVTLDGGMLQPSANITLTPNHPLVIGPGGGAINGNGFGFLNLSANMLTGSGPLIIYGNGSTNTSLQISAAQPNYTGDINIITGRININNASGTLGTGAITVGTGASSSLYLSASTITLVNAMRLQGNGGENRGVVRFQTGGTLNGPVTLLNNAGFSCENAAYPVYLNGNISGPYALQLNGLAGSNASAAYYFNGVNTFTGNLTIPNGTVRIGNTAAIPSGAGTGNVVLNGGATAGTLDINGFDVTMNGLAGVTGAVLGKVINNATGTDKILTIGSGDASSAFAGLLADNTVGTGTLALIKIGTGTLTLSGPNTYSGATTIINGVLQAAAANTLPNGAGKGDVILDGGATEAGVLDVNGFDVAINGLSGAAGAVLSQGINSAAGIATLTVGNADASGAFAGILADTTGTLALAKVGTGTLTLSGASTYTGATTVSNGTLVLTGSLANTAVTIASGGTLTGTGVMGGAVVINGLFEPGGVGAIGTITINNALALNGMTTVDINKTSAVLTCDLVAGLTGATFGGSLTVNATGDLLAEGDTFQIFSGAFAGFSGDFVTVTPASLPGNLHWDTSKLATEGKIFVTSVPAPTNVALDPTKDTGLYNNDGITNLTDLIIIGQALSNVTVSVYEGAALLTTGSVAGGAFSIPFTFAAGAHDLRLTATDPAGNVSLTSAPLFIVVDQTLPSAPSAALATADDTGLLNNDGITNLSTGLTITGACETTASVTVYEGGTSLGVALAGAGAYAVDINLAEGTHALTVEQTDLAGNVSAGAPLSITVDLTPPAISATNPANGAQVASVAVTTITFNETVGNVTADKLTITSDVESVNALSVSPASGVIYAFAVNDVYGTGPVALTFTLLATSGSSTLTDVAGNAVAETSWTVTKDARLIPVTIASASTPEGSWTSQTAIAFSAQFVEAVSGFDPAAEPGDLTLGNCVLTTGSFSGAGADYAFSVTPLAVGPVTVHIPTAICAATAPPAGRPNADSNTWIFNFDNVPPSFSGLVAAPNLGKDGTTVTLTFAAGEPLAPGGQPAVTVNGHAATYKTNTGLNFTYEYVVQASDAEGSATVSMTGADRAFNIGTTADTSALYIDKTAPTVTISTVEPDPLPQTVQITFSESVTGVDEGDLTLTFNGAPIAFSAFTQVTPSLYTVTVPNDQPGDYVLTLTAAGSGIQDLVGNALATGAASSWRIPLAGSAVKLWTRY